MLEVLIVDDTPRVRHQKSTADELEIWKCSNLQKQQEKKFTEGKRRRSHKKLIVKASKVTTPSQHEYHPRPFSLSATSSPHDANAPFPHPPPSQLAAEVAVDEHPPQPYPIQELRVESVSKQQQKLAQHGPAIMGIFHIINIVVIFIVFGGVVESFVL